MGPQITIALKGHDRLSEMIPRIEKIAQWGRRWGFAIAIFLPFLFLVAFSITYSGMHNRGEDGGGEILKSSSPAGAFMRPDFNRQEIPDWRPVLALAEASVEKGELYDTRSLYSRAAQLASWREDWGGLLAAACGLKLLDNGSGSYVNVHTILVRAMMAAESRQSRAGIAAVARAFAAIGNDKAASMVLGRIQTDWPEECKTRRMSIQGVVGEGKREEACADQPENC
jgi:hypothetical protein